MSRRRKIYLSSHAAQRARQRLGFSPHLEGAIRLPKSAPRRLMSIRGDRVRLGTRMWCTSSAVLFVGANDRVVTLVRLHVEDLAKVLVWKMFGMWV